MMRMPLSFFILIPATLLVGSAARAWGRGPDQQIAADPRGIVEVSSFSGSVDVSGWDQPQVSVHSDVSDDVTNVDVHGDHGRTTITVRLHGFFAGGEAHLSIKIPRGSELDVTSVSAEVTSTGVLGMQRLKTVSGSIRADFSQADVEAKTVSGDVTLRGDGKPAGLHVSSISGSIRVARGAGDLEATTVSGALDVQLDPGRAVRARTTSGSMEVQGKLAKDAEFDLQTVSGDVKLHASAGGGYDYEVSTFSGSIRNCFNAEAERTSRYGPGERLIGTRGKGDAHVRIKTMSGGIDVCDKS
jgi:DUF4097 and DUF4098 domain-containing protein YvlB